MSAIELKNAKITSTMLGVEDHGILTCFVNLDFGGSGQGFGGYSLDCPNGKSGHEFRRIGTAFGMQFIKRTIEAVGVETWEKLPGTHCRVKADHGKVHAIGHIIEDRWFVPADLASEMKDAS